MVVATVGLLGRKGVCLVCDRLIFSLCFVGKCRYNVCRFVNYFSIVFFSVHAEAVLRLLPCKGKRGQRFERSETIVAKMGSIVLLVFRLMLINKHVIPLLNVIMNNDFET